MLPSMASQLTKPAFVKGLIAAGAKVNYIADIGYRTTPLHDAARMGNAEIVAALLEAKAKVNVRDSSGQTPLQTATDPEIKRIIAAAGGAE